MAFESPVLQHLYDALETHEATNMEETIQSFEVTKGSKSDDLLSEIRRDQNLKVGLLACSYFEYWRMYEGLREEVV